MKQKRKTAPAVALKVRLPRLGTPRLRRSARARLAEAPTPAKPVEFGEPQDLAEPTSAELEAVAITQEAPPEPTAPAVTHGLRGDPYQLYLREVGQVPLLTPEQEVALAKRIHAGDESAREHMIKANLRLVVKIARDYENFGLPLLDLISEGNIGLMKAVERFDPSKGAKLSTYASWWIKQSIRRALADQSKTIRLPVHAADKLFHIRKAERKLQEVLGREPTDAEIAEEVELTPVQVRNYRTASLAPASLDAAMGDDDSKSFADVVADPKAAAPFQPVLEAGDQEMLRRVMQNLSPREQQVLGLRFGLGNGDAKTLEEVGTQMGVTRERIRQIQEEALRKLRRGIRAIESEFEPVHVAA